MNLLLIGDKVGSGLDAGLRGRGCHVARLNAGVRALKLIATTRFDAVLLKCPLFDHSACKLCDLIRGSGHDIPILVLTVGDDAKLRCAALRAGADDCLDIPCDAEELIWRLRAIVRRKDRRMAAPADHSIVAGPLVFDTAAQTVTSDGVELPLTIKEQDVLRFLMERPNQAVSREQLLNVLWARAADVATNIVDVHICRLRRKLGSHGARIRTVRGIGFRYSDAIPGRA